MLLMDDYYDPDDILMDPDSMSEPEADDIDDKEIDFENPLFSKSTFDQFADETETISELFY